MEFTKYKRIQIAELRPYVSNESLEGVSISESDLAADSPKPGDMIARNPKNHEDQWLVAAQYFANNFELAPNSSLGNMVERAGRELFSHGAHHGWWNKSITYDALDPIGRDEFDGIVLAVLKAAHRDPK